MNYEVQEKVLDYSKIDIGSIIVMNDTLWAVVLEEDGKEDEYLVLSFGTNQVIASFEDIIDVIGFVKLYEDSIDNILAEDEFKLKIVEV